MLLKLNKILLSLFLFYQISFGIEVKGGCTVSPEDAVEVVSTAILTSYNVFPMRLGGIPVMSWEDLPDYNLVSWFPTCVCLKGGLPLPGVKFSMHRAKALVDVVKDPYCSPSLGMKLPIPFGSGKNSYGANGEGGLSNTNFFTYEVHYYRFPLFAMIDKLVDTACVVADPEIVLEYVSELNPIWHNDKYYALLHPITYLVSHPVAQMSCIADCAKATINVGIRELFWCSGCWGTVYPATRNMISSSTTSAAGLAIHRMISNLHEPPLFTLKQETGPIAMCQPYVVAIPDKRQYSVYPVYPTIYPKRISLGKSDLLWSKFLDIPIKNKHNWTWVLYSKRDCCAL